MARKTFWGNRKGKFFHSKIFHSKDLKLKKLVVKSLSMKFKELNRQCCQVADLCRELFKEYHKWNKRIDILLLKRFMIHEKTIKALKNAISTSTEDLNILKSMFAKKLKNCSIRTLRNKWWNLVIFLTQCQDLMADALKVFFEAYDEFKAHEIDVSPSNKNGTFPAIRYFINS